MEPIETLAGRKAAMTRYYGADDPRAVAAGRELAAAKFAAAVDAATAAGLDVVDCAAILQTGHLPASAAA